MSASLLSTPQAEDLMESSLLDCTRADQHMLGNLDGILKSSEWLYTNFTIQATSHIQMVPMSLSCAAQNCDVAMESDGKVTSNPPWSFPLESRSKRSETSRIQDHIWMWLKCDLKKSDTGQI
ncbi:hypothetical protein AMECASPLE_039463 [Ameca splendens]|uniref:Uncharacterized protein n=1 Tax=Ameca splendens TaxID=208324 RepID=A0ABV0YJI6_9TELE